jgi:hypothetical protein
MRKEHPEIRYHLTVAERREIRARSLSGERATAIAKAMHLSRTTVMGQRQRMGLSGKPILNAAKQRRVLALLARRVNQRVIAKEVGASFRTVRDFARAHGHQAIRRGPLTQEETLKLMTAIMNRRASAAQIAKDFKIPYKWSLSLAHSWLNCRRFLPSWRNPLQSYFASTPPPALGDTEVDGLFVRFVSELWYGPLPASQYDNALIDAMIAVCGEYQNQPALIVENLRTNLSKALSTLRLSQTGSVH